MKTSVDVFLESGGIELLLNFAQRSNSIALNTLWALIKYEAVSTRVLLKEFVDHLLRIACSAFYDIKLIEIAISGLVSAECA